MEFLQDEIIAYISSDGCLNIIEPHVFWHCAEPCSFLGRCSICRKRPGLGK